jgi:hypothetical protein
MPSEIYLVGLLYKIRPILYVLYLDTDLMSELKSQ